MVLYSIEMKTNCDVIDCSQKTSKGNIVHFNSLELFLVQDGAPPHWTRILRDLSLKYCRKYTLRNILDWFLRTWFINANQCFPVTSWLLSFVMNFEKGKIFKYLLRGYSNVMNVTDFLDPRSWPCVNFFSLGLCQKIII